MKKLLWIVPKNPYPVNDGAKRAIESIVCSLAEKAEVHLLVMLRKDDQSIHPEMQKKWGLKSVRSLATKASVATGHRVLNAIKSFTTSPMPMTYIDYCSTEVLEELKKIVSAVEADFVVAETLHVANACLQAGINFIYRAQNVESLIWRRLASEQNNPVVSLFLEKQADKILELEKQVALRSKKNFYISDVDRNYFRDKVGQLNFKSFVLPIGLKVKTIEHEQTDDNRLRLLFLGNIDWAPNRHGLNWFFENVWRELIQLRPETHLSIVGSGNFESFYRYESPHVKVKGFVESVEIAYTDCDLVISPIFYGSGVRVKLIECASFGRTFIGTKYAVEGSGMTNQMYFPAESKVEWIKTLNNISKEDIVGRAIRAQQSIKERFDPSTLADRFLNELDI